MPLDGDGSFLSHDVASDAPRAARVLDFDGTRGVTLAGVVRSEWTKLRSLRSTWTTVALALIAAIGLGFLLAILRAGQLGAGGVHAAPGNPAPTFNGRFDPIAISLRGLLLAQLFVGALGVQAVSGEYSSGTIFTSLSAVPRRWPVVVGKVVTLAATTFVVAFPACLAAFLAGQGALGSDHLGVSLWAPGALRAVFGGAAFLTGVAVLGLGLGLVFRSATGAMITLYALLLALPASVAALSNPWRDRITQYLPLNAGTALTATVPHAGTLAPWAGGAVLLAYAGAATAFGVIVLLVKDA
jgi:ABC-type transport system involved in multi-copper enzyme maturation permease subunit